MTGSHVGKMKSKDMSPARLCTVLAEFALYTGWDYLHSRSHVAGMCGAVFVDDENGLWITENGRKTNGRTSSAVSSVYRPSFAVKQERKTQVAC